MNESEIKEIIKLQFSSPCFKDHSFICTECKKEVTVSHDEAIQKCLLVDRLLKRGIYKGLCPACTKKWYEERYKHWKLEVTVKGIV